MTRAAFCGKPSTVLPRGRRRGKPHECFVIGIAVGASRRRGVRGKPATGLRSIPGIGVKFARRLEQEFNLRSRTDLEDRFKRLFGERQRRELLKKMVRGFQTRKVNRRSFALVREYLQTRGITVADMSPQRSTNA